MNQKKYSKSKNTNYSNQNFTPHSNHKSNKFNKPQNKIKTKKKLPYFYEVDSLLKRYEIGLPPPGVYCYQLPKADQQLSQSEVSTHFDDLPLSKFTHTALKKAKFMAMTDIQRCSIPHSLAGRDILGCSRTGTGKTLCFVIPILEKLYIEKVSSLDGICALIIVPVRELAIQIYDVFRIVGESHQFSIGVAIGGKKVKEEKSLINNMNILVTTPGRLLHHMNETPNFSLDSLKILVLDEVDRILDMGFAETLDQILLNIPKSTQTLLFSATLTKTISRMAKLNLKNPEYISIHSYHNIADNNEEAQAELPEELKSITPTQLKQHYMIIPIEEKLNILFSFLKTHRRHKTLVFLSSCKQVRFIYEVFSKLKLNIPILHLQGRQGQVKRIHIFYKFLNSPNGVLFATDIASRGIDFPEVNWVIQLDSPPDVDTYIHRIGRTARYLSGGNSLLLLTEPEKGFAKILEDKKIEVKKIQPNKNKLFTITSAIQALVSENPELLQLAKKAIVTYLKSIHVMSNKSVFDIRNIDLTQLSKSYGLITAPTLKFLSPSEIKQKQQEQQKPPKITKLQKLRQKIKDKKILKKENNQNEDDHHQTIKHILNLDQIEEEDFWVKKNKPSVELEENYQIKEDFQLSKRQRKKITIGGPFQGKNKKYFTEKGVITHQEYVASQLNIQNPKNKEKIDEKEQSEFLEKVKQKIDENEPIIEELRKKRLHEKRKKLRSKRKRLAHADSVIAELGNPSDEESSISSNQEQEKIEESILSKKKKKFQTKHPEISAENVQKKKKKISLQNLEEKVLTLIDPSDI